MSRPKVVVSESSSSDEEDVVDVADDMDAMCMANPVLKLGADTYDGFFFTICCLYDKTYVKYHGGVAQCRFVMLLAGLRHILAMSIQFLLVFLFYHATVRHQSYDPDYTPQASELLRNAVESVPPAPLNATDAVQGRALAMCNMDDTHRYAHTVVLLLWMFKMVIETTTVVHKSAIMYFTPSDTKRDRVFTKMDGQFEITHISTPMKCLSLLTIQLPHTLLIAFLTYVGVLFLVMSTKLSVLILKAVGLQYLLTIDSFIYVALESLMMKNRLARTAYAYKYVFEATGQSDAMPTLLKSCFVVGLTLFFQFYVFGYVAVFRSACDAYDLAFSNKPADLVSAVMAV